MADLPRLTSGITTAQYAPTSAQQNCIRYAFTDGECTIRLDGCRDCPATLYDQYLDARIAKTGRAASPWKMLGVAAMIWLILASAMSLGLARQAHEMQVSERV